MARCAISLPFLVTACRLLTTNLHLSRTLDVTEAITIRYRVYQNNSFILIDCLQNSLTFVGVRRINHTTSTVAQFPSETTFRFKKFCKPVAYQATHSLPIKEAHMRSLCWRSCIIVHKTFLVVSLTFLTCVTLFARTASSTISGAVKIRPGCCG
jgi:hypothetical protein